MIERIESRIQKFVQDWIADPLQWSGFALEWQIRTACWICAIGWIWEAYNDAMKKSWGGLAMDGLIIPMALSDVVYGISGAEKISRQASWIRYLGLFWALSSLIDLATVWSDHKYSNLVVSLGLFLRHYLIGCKPKPPIGNLHAAQENA